MATWNKVNLPICTQNMYFKASVFPSRTFWPFPNFLVKQLWSYCTTLQDVSDWLSHSCHLTLRRYSDNSIMNTSHYYILKKCPQKFTIDVYKNSPKKCPVCHPFENSSQVHLTDFLLVYSWDRNHTICSTLLNRESFF